MTKRRLSRRERLDAHGNATLNYWPIFRERLNQVQSFLDAVALGQSGPGPEMPGRKFHSNLAFFLHDFSIPHGSNGEERALYLELVKRFDARGELKPGVVERVEAALKLTSDLHR